MTVTVAEAQTTLAKIIAQAEAGEEVFIAREPDRPAVNLVPLASGGGQLARHPDLISSTVTYDPAVLVQSLPPEEWGDLADRFILATARILSGRILSPDTIMPNYPGIITEW